MGLADFAVLKSKDAQSFPGPGQYDPKLPTGRYASIRGRTETKAVLLTGTTDAIGPGKYDIPTTVGTAPGGKWSASPRGGSTTSGVGHDSPAGVSKYDTTYHDMSRHPSSPRYSFGGSATKTTPRRRENDEQRIPAPPAAETLPTDLPRHMRKGPSFGLRPANNGPIAVKSVGPGPGGYDVKRFGDEPPKPRPPLQPHVDADTAPQKAANPGPGAYDPHQRTIADEVRPRHQGHVSHGTMAGRNFPPEPRSYAVGPGQYEDPTTIAARAAHGKAGVSILARPTEYTDMDDIYPRPAPGDYAVPSCFDTKPNKGFTFGSRHAVPKSGMEVPGPGTHDVPQYSMAAEIQKSPRGVVLFNARGTGFKDGVKTTSARAGATTGEGGAAAASVGSSTGKSTVVPPLPKLALTQKTAPSFTMSGRHKPAEPDMNGPGPGVYDVTKYEQTSARGTTFFRSSYGR